MRTVAALGLVAASCVLPAVDYEGKRCLEGLCPADLTCVEGRCLGAASLDAGHDGGRDFLTIAVAAPSDDATWSGSDERLRSNDVERALEVGPQRALGVRFGLPVPPGSTLEDVRYEVARATGDAPDGWRLTVRVWNSISVPAFDDAHVHPAELHDPAGFTAGDAGFSVDWHPLSRSDNLAALLQPLVDRPDWSAGAVIGLVLSAPPSATQWAGFFDVTTSEPEVITSRLTVQYRW